MTKQDLLHLTQQLDDELKELICVTDTHILVKWLQDGTYVSWRYGYSEELGRYSFDLGNYLPTATTTIEQAILAFAERINKC